jgi:23S rRNA pseudouridine2605 synthase
MQRIQKLLSNRGYCSRRKAEELIESGKVVVDGTTATLGDKAEENATILVDGKPVNAEKRRYLLLNKPTGYVTAVEDRHEKTVMELLTVTERVYPVGRLDKETSGLLLLTNDGDWAHRIMHPRYELGKSYEATLDKEVTDTALEQLRAGVNLEDGTTRPAKVEQLSKERVRLTIHEGKNRIVRRMFETLGYQVVQLHRKSIGKLTLGQLTKGRYRDLTSAEVESFN